MKKIAVCFASVALVLGAPVPLPAAMTKPMNIEELIDAADRIFVGTVLSVKAELPEPKGIPAVATEFRVEEVLKGTVGESEVVRQLARVGPGGKIVLFSGLPRFSPGEKIMVFLPVPSSLGLSSPIGLDQGVFRVAAKSGVENDDSPILNASQNRLLFRRLQGKRTRELARGFTSTDSTGKMQVKLTVGGMRELVRSHRGSTP